MTFLVKFSFISLFLLSIFTLNISIEQLIKTVPIFPNPLGNTPLNNTKEPKLPPKTYNSGYDEELAIDKLFPMASAAYGEQDADYTNCLQKTFTIGATLVRSFTVDCSAFNGKDDKLCAAFIAVSEQDQAVILSFRGTTNPIQFLDMIGATFLEQANFYFQAVLNKFHDQSLLNYVHKEVLVNPTYQLWITGASLGGALASLAAGMLVEKYKVKPEIIKLVTFAQPRTGTKEWADSMEIIPYKYRIVQGMDVVPHIPFQSLPSFIKNMDTPSNIDLSFTYLHFRGEVWYPDGSEKRGNYKVCNSTNEDETCSNRNLKTTEITQIYFDEAIYLGHSEVLEAANYKIENAPNAFLGMIAKGCQEGLHPSQYKAFEL